MTGQKIWVIDANIILRHILVDLPNQALQVDKILQKAENGALTLLIPEPVISDVVFVLNHLKVPKVKIAESVHGWISLPGVALLGIELNIVENALDLFVDKNIKWSDALIAAKMLRWNYKAICTFDKHFDRIADLEKIVPMLV
jgi:uncharacterized protein